MIPNARRTRANGSSGTAVVSLPGAIDVPPKVPRLLALDMVLPHLVADAFPVLGRRGRRRLVLLVSCPCGARHMHYAPEGFVSGRRTAACGRGRYVLHAAMTA